jgi:integrase
VTYTNKTQTVARDRVFSSAELREVWAALLEDDDYSDIVRLLMLTGQRREEIGALDRVKEIDFDKLGSRRSLPILAEMPDDITPARSTR